MIFYYIAGTNRTDDIERNSLSINDELQQKTNTAKFNIIDNSKPTEGQEVLIYDGTFLTSASGSTLVYQDADGNIEKHNIFRAGDQLYLGVGEATEEIVTIDSINLSTKTITLTASIADAHSANEQLGKRIFGGNIIRVKDYNKHLLENIEYKVECTDFTKLFDKKLVNDTWQGKTALYIINRFVNDTINYNFLLDDFEFKTDGAIQAEWIESGDGDNPTTDSSEYKEGSYSGVLNWTNSGGTATFSSTPTLRDISDVTKASSGAPTDGKVCFWYKQTNYTKVVSIKIRVGSGSDDYTECILIPESDNDWHYARLSLPDGAETGTPVWTDCDYAAIIVTETDDSSINIDGLRLNETNCFTFDKVETGLTYDDFRASRKKPTLVMERLAKESGYFWYIDYERDIHFFDIETNTAPFSLTTTSDNFYDLRIAGDISQLKNRQVVRGGTSTSSSRYEQSFLGDGAVREWNMKTKFVDLTCSVETGAGSSAQTIGVEYFANESAYDYFSNYNEKTVRAAATTSTLSSGTTISFSYNEVIPILVQQSDPASIDAMKGVFNTDGIFDGAPITDRNIKRREEAQQIAFAELDRYSNTILTATFKTSYYGLKGGQIIRITDTNNSRVNRDFLIQKIQQRIKGGHVSEFNVLASSTLFGIVELFQQLLRRQDSLEVDENEIIENIINPTEEMTLTESFGEGTKSSQAETMTITESMSVMATSSNWKWKPSATMGARWGIAVWG